ncbi:MAG: carboxypeptidase-like regulatory domain-containing protein [Acidobacteria bacterium]|nr:carboxypeptidase-like regulatory domain-containing protein [Acidobacteriota bacterium]
MAVVAALGVIALAQGAGTGQRELPSGRRTPTRAGATPGEEPKGTAIIRGFVVAADTGQPLRRAQVRLSSPETRESRLATTDSQGRFEARELVGGRYTISASKGGFVSLQYGQRRPSEQGTPIDIKDGQLIERLLIGLPRGSVISGRITDEFGEPVANAVVSAARFGYAGGARRALPIGGQNGRDTTDDLGQFRLFGLAPGDYYITAAFRGGGDVTDPAQDVTGFAPTYYPGASSLAEAQRVAVGLGQETTNVSFALIATRLVRVSGNVIDSNGAPLAAGGSVMLVPADRREALPMMRGGGGRVEPTGRFRITNVAPGRYLLHVRTGRQGAEFGRMAIAVGDQDLDNLTIVTAPGATASGRVLTDSGQPPSLSPGTVTISSRPADADSAPLPGSNNARVNADWTFELAGLYDMRLIRAGVPQGWALDAVTLNGQDITDVPLEFSPGQKVTGLRTGTRGRTSQRHTIPDVYPRCRDATEAECR